MEPHLTVREFTDRMGAQDKRLDHITRLIETDQTERRQRDLETERRVTTLETHRERAIVAIGIYTTIIGSIVGGVTGWVAGLWRN